MRKNTTIQRLHIVRGQIDGLIKLIEGSADCRKVTVQFYAINAAFRKTMELYLKENLASCFDTVNLSKKQTINFLLKEILKS